MNDILAFIDSLPEEKPSDDFPTSDEEMAKFLATHPKVEVPEKYKTPNWLFDKQPSDDLEEAAEEYADKHGFRVPYDGSNNYYDDVDVKASKEGFIAGAEWMMKKDVEDMYMSDNRHFLKCYEQGKVDMNVEMMKDAVEAKIYGYDDGSFELIASWLDMPNNSIYKDGDKVKIVIIKGND